MSLKRFIAMPDVRAKLKTLRPNLPRRFNVPLKAAPRTTHYTVVGTAFDYLLRFEIQRRAPHATAARLAAEAAPDVIWKQTGRGASWMEFPGAEIDDFTDPDKAAREMADRVMNVVDAGNAVIAAYVKKSAPSPTDQADLAAHAIRMAKLDDVYRAGRLEPTFAEVDSEDVRDLLALLAIVPFAALLHPTLLLLNPSFGESSRLLAGADADLIAGDLLLDLKTTKDGEIKAETLDQLLGYFLLARRERQADPPFPDVNRVGLYFSRHGHLWTVGATIWTENPEFADMEQWFFMRAKEVFAKKPLFLRRRTPRT